MSVSPSSSTPPVSAVVIGAGQAGLAVSRCLTDADVDHVVLERGRVAERWRSERWDSLRLLTPNWQNRLPGWHPDGEDPDGFMSMPELIGHLEAYASSFSAPVVDDTTVTHVAADPRRGGYVVATDRGAWRTDHVFVATGACDRPAVPTAADELATTVHQIAPPAYRRPDQLPEGGVLVVGGSASGVQLAAELRAAGREVVLSAGRHVRLPRRYRGLDIQWWLEQIGVFDVRADDTRDLGQARREPSLQLTGDPSGRSLDLAVLQGSGVHLAGRLQAIDGTRVSFADDLLATCGVADRRQIRILDRIDAYIRRAGLEREVDGPTRPAAVRPHRPHTDLDLRQAGITSVLWATGYRRSYPWLDLPVLDRNGDIAHHGGITAAPGLYVVGMPFLRHRNSTFIGGVGRDARHLVGHLLARRGRHPSVDRLGARR